VLTHCHPGIETAAKKQLMMGTIFKRMKLEEIKNTEEEN